MTTPVSSIRNLGPAVEAAFRKAGIRSAEEVHELGADRAYARLLEAGTRPHFIGYYCLVLGLQGRPWNDCRGTEKADLRKRFDAIKSRAKPSSSSELEQVLDQIGVVKKK